MGAARATPQRPSCAGRRRSSAAAAQRYLGGALAETWGRAGAQSAAGFAAPVRDGGDAAGVRGALELDLHQATPVLYLLSETDRFFRGSSAGGSAAVRSHMKVVRTRLRRLMMSDPTVRLPSPADIAVREHLPATAHFSRATSNGVRERTPTAGLVSALSECDEDLGLLSWELGYEHVSLSSTTSTLASRYAYAQLVGPSADAPVFCKDLALGVVLFAPRAVYPLHYHVDVAESYVTLSGSWSQNDAGVFVPGSLAFNAPGARHRLTTGDYEPTLLLYAWVASSNEKLAEAVSSTGVFMRRPCGRRGGRRSPPDRHKHTVIIDETAAADLAEDLVDEELVES